MDITLIIIALAFSAFFSGMEIAFVASNRLRIGLEMKRNNLSASVLSLFYSNREQFISTMLVGNNIALVVYGIKMADALEPSLIHLSNPILIILLKTLISTGIVLITAEFIPKTLFRVNPNFWMKLFSIPTALIYILLYPISRFSTFIAKKALRLTGIKITGTAHSQALGKVDLDYFIQESLDNSQDNQEFDTEVKIFQNVLDFSSIKIRDCIVPRTDIVAVDWNSPMSLLMEKFVESGKSKLLIYKETIDNIVGYVHSSELFVRPNDWHTVITPVSIVPESMSARLLMQQFLQQKKSLAVVVDEFGGTAGIVTLEDILEEIIGDIEDEHDSDTPLMKKLTTGEYLLSGRAEIDQINEMFQLNVPESDHYATIAGFILHQIGRFPKANEELLVNGFSIKIIKLSTSKVELIKLRRAEE